MTKDFAREYHSLDRVDWIRQQPCIITGLTPCENVHVRSGGMGRKDDYTSIVPMHWTKHRELHALGTKSFEARYGVDLAAEAARTEARWQALDTLRVTP